MTDFLKNIDLQGSFGPYPVATLIRVAMLLALGLPLARLLSSLLFRVFRHQLSPQSGMLLRKGVFYGGFVLIVLMVMTELNFKLTALLGAAGIAGVAIGFASQTSLSNVISGLFLISEKPFQVGDLVKVGDTVGLVLSIDLLSIKLRTFDNRFVRIPNETIIKGELVNVTRFPIRRLDINMGVAYKEDIRRVVAILKEVADQNPYCLDEPDPLVCFTGFGDSQLNIFIGVWHAREDFLLLRDSILVDIKERFDREGIEIPFPHRTVYVGEVTKPLPISLTEKAGAPSEETRETPEQEPPAPLAR